MTALIAFWFIVLVVAGTLAAVRDDFDGLAPLPPAPNQPWDEFDLCD